MDKTQRRRSGQAGFTLIELMVVIAIIGILAAVVVPKLVGNVDEANVTAAKASIRGLENALVAYKLKLKNFPTTNDGLEALISNGKQNFLNTDKVPVDPWGNPYIYTSPGTHGNDYEIVSYGRDGQPGGEGYDADVESWNIGNE